MNKNIMFVLFFCFILISNLSCQNKADNKTVKLSYIDNGIKKEKIVRENIETLIIGGFRETVEQVEGVEQLKNLKTIELLSDVKNFEEILNKVPNLKNLSLLNYDIYDTKFFDNLSKLEVLYIGAELKDLDFLKKLTELKVLNINNLTLEKNELDFKTNKKLKCLHLGGIYIGKYDFRELTDDEIFRLNQERYYLQSDYHDGKKTPPELNIKNIPDELEYLDISSARFSGITEKIFDIAKNVKTFIIGTDEDKKMVEGYFRKHPNQKRPKIVYDYPKNVLPPEYNAELILKGNPENTVTLNSLP